MALLRKQFWAAACVCGATQREHWHKWILTSTGKAAWLGFGSLGRRTITYFLTRKTKYYMGVLSNKRVFVVKIVFQILNGWIG